MQTQNLSQKFEQKLLEAFNRGKQFLSLDPQNGYQESDKDSNLGLVNHKTQDPKFDCSVTRGEGILKVNSEKLLQTLLDPVSVKKTEARMQEYTLLSKTSSGHQLAFMVFSPPMGDDRESACIIGVFQEGNTKYFVMTSIDHPDHLEPKQGRTKCIHYYMIYAITPKDNGTHVVFVSCMDPMGSFIDFVKSKISNSRAIERLASLDSYFKNN